VIFQQEKLNIIAVSSNIKLMCSRHKTKERFGERRLYPSFSLMHIRRVWRCQRGNKNP